MYTLTAIVVIYSLAVTRVNIECNELLIVSKVTLYKYSHNYMYKYSHNYMYKYSHNYMYKYSHNYMYKYSHNYMYKYSHNYMYKYSHNYMYKYSHNYMYKYSHNYMYKYADSHNYMYKYRIRVKFGGDKKLTVWRSDLEPPIIMSANYFNLGGGADHSSW